MSEQSECARTNLKTYTDLMEEVVRCQNLQDLKVITFSLLVDCIKTQKRIGREGA